MQDEHREAVVELRVLWSSTTQVWDLVLKGSNEMSSLAASLSSTADLIEGRVDATTTNGVHWGPGWRCLSPCHASLSWSPSCCYLGPDAMRT
jgi:hypothetical protein